MTDWTPLALSASVALTFAALYEPVRLALLPYYANLLGGVGGVGGLANLQAPEGKCMSEQSSTFHGHYCFKAGIGGGPFTVLAIISLTFWVGPWFIGTASYLFHKAIPSSSVHEVQANVCPKRNTISTFIVFWTGVNILWFATPLAMFWNSLGDVHGTSTSFGKHILAISLAAAHPLSWNLSLVAIPVSGVLTRLINSKREEMFLYHRFVAYWTVFWAFLHGTGELLFLAISKSSFGTRSRLVADFDIHHDGENLIYLFGLLAVFLLSSHAVASYYRKRLGPVFRPLHRMLAVTLLTVAAAHWWPFALFFVPATALHGCSLAIICHEKSSNSSLINPTDDEGRHRSSEQQHNTPVIGVMESSSCVVSPFSQKKTAAFFLVALSSSFFGLYVVWSWRQNYMLSSSANLYLPFLFPALSVPVCIMTAFVAVSVCLHVTMNPVEEEQDRHGSDSDSSSPLLTQGDYRGDESLSPPYSSSVSNGMSLRSDEQDVAVSRASLLLTPNEV